MDPMTKDDVEGEEDDGNLWNIVTCNSLRLITDYLPRVSLAVCASDRNVRALTELSAPVHKMEVVLANHECYLREKACTVELLFPSHAVQFQYDDEHQEYVECIVDVRDVHTVERVLWWLQTAAVRSLRLEGAECLSAAGLQRVFSVLFTERPLTAAGKPLPVVLEELTCNGSCAYHAVMLRDISILKRCQLLKKIQMDWCWLLKSVAGFEEFKMLETLRIPGTRVSAWKALGDCGRLKYLDMSCTDEWMSLAGMENLTSLVTLELAYTSVEDLKPLKGNKQLESLNLSHCTQLCSLSGLECLLALEKLDLSGTAVSCLTALRDCRRLHHLRLAGCTELRSLAGLENSTELEELVLQESSVDSLIPIRECRRLRKLDLKSCRQLRTLVGLENSLELKELVLLDSAVESLVPLQERCQLRKLKLKYCEKLRALMENLPEGEEGADHTTATEEEEEGPQPSLNVTS